MNSIGARSSQSQHSEERWSHYYLLRLLLLSPVTCNYTKTSPLVHVINMITDRLWKRVSYFQHQLCGWFVHTDWIHYEWIWFFPHSVKTKVQGDVVKLLLFCCIRGQTAKDIWFMMIGKRQKTRFKKLEPAEKWLHYFLSAEYWVIVPALIISICTLSCS